MDNTRTIEIDGFNVTIDTAKTGSWAAFKLLKKAREATDELEQFAALVELVEYATDATEEKVVKHLGGDLAPMLEVVGLMAKIASECYPKN